MANASRSREEESFGPAPPQVHPNIANLRGTHRAAHPDGVSALQVESHVLTANEWPVVCPRFLEALKLAGVDYVRMIGYLRLDHHLLTALIERWCPQTNTFHLAVGEMTITLEDVAIILGLQVDGPPIIGPPVVGAGRRWHSWPDCCNDLLGMHPDPNVVYQDPYNEEVTAKFRMGQARSQTCLPLRWLRWTFQRQSYEDLDDITFRRHVRAYIMFIIGSFLLPDTSGNEVHLQYLPLLEDLELFSKFSLGGAVLANVYRELTEATKPKRSRISSCVHLIQVWSWEHLHVGRPVLNVPQPDEIYEYGVGYRWSSTWVREMPATNVQMYRDEFDGLLESQVIWEPYTPRIRQHMSEICSAGAAIWLSRVPLICWKRVEWYLPDRVLRQFGCLPKIDVLPIDHSFVRVDGRGKADTDWSAYHHRYISLWQNRRSSVVNVTPATENNEKLRAIKRYMRWYKSWASLFVLKAPSEPPHTYYPHASTERELREVILSADQIFEPFYNSEDNSAQQIAINKFHELMISTKKNMYISDTTYRDADEEMGAGPSTQQEIFNSQTSIHYADLGQSSMPEVTPEQHSFHYMSAGQPTFPFPTLQQQHGHGVMTQFQQWPNTDTNWPPVATSTPSQQPNLFPSQSWNTTVTSQNVLEHTQEPEQTHVQRRQRHQPDKYTPGSGAIPKRKERKK